MKNKDGGGCSGFVGTLATVSLTIAVLSLWTALSDWIFSINVWWFVVIFIIAAIKSNSCNSCCSVDSKKRSSKKKKK
tara:strand:- start:244 stop:474 length:231 start_codon:yes stop_codon:yes gene_type:complete